MPPMFGRKVVERKQGRTVFPKAVDRLGKLRSAELNEALERFVGRLATPG